jgi:dephospho-CoA kinase
MRPLHIGLTGGIGSGKSTVAQTLVELGAALVDTDAIARRLTAPRGVALPAIAQAFGPELVSDQGGLDRDRMRALAFSDPSARRRLEAILHPLIGDTARAEATGADAAAFEAQTGVETARRAAAATREEARRMGSTSLVTDERRP